MFYCFGINLIKHLKPISKTNIITNIFFNELKYSWNKNVTVIKSEDLNNLGGKSTKITQSKLK